LGLFDHLIELSDFFKTNNIRIFSFYKTHLTASQEKWQEIVGQLQTYVQKAAELGKVLVLENEHVCYTDNIARTLRLLEELPSPGLKLNLDPGNFFSARDATNPEAYEVFYQRNLVAHMHIKDPFLFVPVVGAFFGVVGEGKINYQKLLQQAQNHQYKGYFSLETHCVKNKEDTSRKSLKNLRKMLDDLGIA
jgi:sugar phosphate isomerase/epimerase